MVHRIPIFLRCKFTNLFFRVFANVVLSRRNWFRKNLKNAMYLKNIAGKLKLNANLHLKISNRTRTKILIRFSYIKSHASLTENTPVIQTIDYSHRVLHTHVVYQSIKYLKGDCPKRRGIQLAGKRLIRSRCLKINTF